RGFESVARFQRNSFPPLHAAGANGPVGRGAHDVGRLLRCVAVRRLVATGARTDSSTGRAHGRQLFSIAATRGPGRVSDARLDAARFSQDARDAADPADRLRGGAQRIAVFRAESMV